MRDFLERTFLGGLEAKARGDRGYPIPDNPVPAWPLVRNDPRWGGYSLQKGIKEGYEVKEVVRACIDAVAEDASSVPWRISKFSDAQAKARYEWERKSVPPAEMAYFNREWRSTVGLTKETKKVFELEPQPHHDLENLLERPNEYMDRKYVIYLMCVHLALAGNAILKKVRSPFARSAGASAKPDELFPIFPDKDKFKAVPSSTSIIDHYEHKLNNTEDPLEYAPEDIIHVMLPNPNDFFWGIPILQSGIRTLETDAEAVSWNKAMFANRGVPDLGISFEKDMPVEKYDAIRAQLRMQFLGVDNARTPLVVGNAAKFQQLSLSAAELDFIVSRKLSARYLCSLFRVDPRYIFIADDLGNPMEVSRFHWTNVVLPVLDRFQGVFDRALEPEFPGNLLVWYDTAGVAALADDLHKRIQSAKVAWSWGEPRDNINRRWNLGLPDTTEGGDIGWMPASAIPIPQAIAQMKASIAGSEAVQEAFEEGLNVPNVGPDGAGSGNTDTSPDGGDDPGTPDDDKPSDDDDSSSNNDNKPSMGSSSFALELPPTTRWTDAEAMSWLEEQGFVYTDCKSETNHYVFELDLNAAPAGYVDLPDGVSMGHTDDLSMKAAFYHGEKDERMARAVRKARERWGPTPDFESMAPTLRGNGNH